MRVRLSDRLPDHRSSVDKTEMPRSLCIRVVSMRRVRTAYHRGVLVFIPPQLIVLQLEVGARDPSRNMCQEASETGSLRWQCAPCSIRLKEQGFLFSQSVSWFFFC